MSNEISYDPSKTFFVNNIGSNYLFRGNEPLIGNSFAYSELQSQIQKIQKINLQNYTLLDISLIDCTQGSELSYLETEFSCFSQDFTKLFSNNPWPPLTKGYNLTKKYGTQLDSGLVKASGSIIWYPVQGCNHNDPQNVETKQYAFPKLVDYLNELLNNSKNTIVYFHCLHGHDRTSALTACYMMKYLRKSHKSVLKKPAPEGAVINNEPWEQNYKNLVNWYHKNYISVPSKKSSPVGSQT